jgi:hypothetical protein
MPRWKSGVSGPWQSGLLSPQFSLNSYRLQARIFHKLTRALAGLLLDMKDFTQSGV